MIPWYNKLLQSCPILLQGLKNKNLAKVVKCKISQITNYNLSRKVLPLNLFFFPFYVNYWTLGLVKQRPMKSLLSICPFVRHKVFSRLDHQCFVILYMMIADHDNLLTNIQCQMGQNLAQNYFFDIFSCLVNRFSLKLHTVIVSTMPNIQQR